MRFRQLASIHLFVTLSALAQTAQPPPSFEVASVKPVPQGRPGSGPLRGGPGTDSPGELTGTASLKGLLMRAYDLKGYQLSGPAWMESERYRIAARIPQGANRELVALMLQTLLAERFHLVAHRETRQLPIYTMTVGRNGPKLKQSRPAVPVSEPAFVSPKFTIGPDGFPELAAGADVPRSYEIAVGGSDGLVYKLWARRETMQQLADRLSSHLNRAVIDMTQLTAQYDFALAYSSESAGGGIPRTDPPPDEIDVQPSAIMSDAVPSIFTAIQSQLGLRLQESKAPLAVLVVDAVEKIPTSN
jgi:uncharacterized protein (TIGR03435 family)